MLDDLLRARRRDRPDSILRESHLRLSAIVLLSD